MKGTCVEVCRHAWADPFICVNQIVASFDIYGYEKSLIWSHDCIPHFGYIGHSWQAYQDVPDYIWLKSL